MATTKAITGNVQKNDGATVLYGGNVATGSRNVTNAPWLNIIGRDGDMGSNVTHQLGYAESGLAGQGVFGKLTAGEYVVLGGDITTTLAGVAKTQIAKTGQDYGYDMINNQTRRYVHVKVSGQWDYLTGALISPQNVSGVVWSTDDAAVPTRSIPGEFAYRDGGATVRQADYSEKTG